MIDKTWTLFLDRDGVINRRIVDDYVKKWEDFEFLPGVPEAIRDLSMIFNHILIVSNQQGIGKGLMTKEDLKAVHEAMTGAIRKAGGRIDGIYHCPDLAATGSFLRKPAVGMGLRARREFPDISFRKSLMAGDSVSDMIFGKRLGMKTVFLCDDLRKARQMPRVIDFVLPDLPALAAALK
ncbi:MAG: D-glycero-alpha-D-manno-heptose-1,7-bisphosphate 7-phosphatase [Syntrophothermus sp.]